MPIKFSEKTESNIREILKRYPTAQAALLPVLWVAEREFGWISPEAMDLVAKTLDLSPAHVYGVATFYSMLHKKPVGKYHLQVCRTLPCALMGAETITAYLKKRLGIEGGETTPDGRFTLSEVECLASCGTAPMMRVNETYYENLNEAEIDRILESLA